MSRDRPSPRLLILVIAVLLGMVASALIRRWF